MVGRFFELEAKYELKKIKINNFYLWPYLRIYFGYKLTYDVTSAKLDAINIRLILLTLFIGFKNLFKRYDYIFFSDSEQRREINGKFYDRFDYVDHILNKRSLFFEAMLSKRYKQKQIPTRQRVSRSILYTFEYVLLNLFRFHNIEGIKILDEINSNYKLAINYRYFGRRFLAQYVIGKILAKLYQPKAVFFITPYTNLGYLVAFKESNIRVVEMQHGVINRHHLGYNPSIDFGDIYRPDHLFTFGIQEREVFQHENYYINHREIYPVGNFYFEYLISEYKGDDKIRELRKTFSKVICVSAEFDVEVEIISFINQLAQRLPDILFLYMPRNRKAVDYKELFFESNIVIADWLNAYQVIIQSDFHSCVRSTTALEAIALGTQNVLINIKDYSHAYFGTILSDTNITKIVNTVDEYCSVLSIFEELPKDQIRKSPNNIFVNDFHENLQTALKCVLSQ